MSMKVNASELQTVGPKEKNQKRTESKTQTFKYKPTENDKNMGLKVEKRAMRCAGHASKIADKNSIIGGTVHASLVDVATAPAMVATDMLTGANDDAGKNGQRTTGRHYRLYKGPDIFKPAVFVTEMIAAPFNMIYDLITGSNE